MANLNTYSGWLQIYLYKSMDTQLKIYTYSDMISPQHSHNTYIKIQKHYLLNN